MTRRSLFWYSTNRILGHTYLTNALPPAPVVVDLGGNRGEFSAAMAALHNASCIAVEPNARLAAEIRRQGRADRVIEFAIGDSNGTATLALFERDDASTIHGAIDRTGVKREDEVQCIVLHDLLDDLALAHIDLLKVDIEGMEIGALTGLGPSHLRHISQITVEFHDAQGYVNAEEVRAVYRHLKRGGFRHLRTSVRDHSDVLFAQSALFGGHAWAATSALKWPRAAGRWASRYLRLIADPH